MLWPMGTLTSWAKLSLCPVDPFRYPFVMVRNKKKSHLLYELGGTYFIFIIY